MSSALHWGARRRLTIAGLVAAAATTLLAIAPSAHAAKGMEVSVQDDGVFVTRSTPFDIPTAYTLLDGLQVTRMRLTAQWNDLNDDAQCRSRKKPRRPVYDFSALDGAIDSARAQGIKVLLTITGPAPAWANSKKKCGQGEGADFNPDVKEFGKFAKVVAKRFKGRVDQYSIWNEPNRKGWLQPSGTNGTQYQKLYPAGYKAVKSVDRKAKVFIGELAPFVRAASQGQDPLDFLRQMTCTNSRFQPLPRKRCPTLRADGFAHHPYDFDRRPTQKNRSRDAVTIANLRSLTSALDKLKRIKRLVPNRGSKLDLYLTEYGYFASRISSRSKVFPESARARYLVQAFKIAQKNPRVKQMLQYLLVQYPNAGTTEAAFNFDTSIVKLDGTQMETYKALSEWATAAAAKRQIKAAR